MSGREECIKISVKSDVTLKKLHAGLDRAKVFLDVPMTFHLAGNLKALDLLSNETLWSFGMREDSEFVFKRAPINITVSAPAIQPVAIRVPLDKSIHLVLQSVRNSLDKPSATFAFNGRAIIDESKTVGEYGLVEGSVLKMTG